MLSTKLRTQNWPLYKNYKADVSSVSPLLLGGFRGFSSGIEGGGVTGFTSGMEGGDHPSRTGCNNRGSDNSYKLLLHRINHFVLRTSLEKRLLL